MKRTFTPPRDGSFVEVTVRLKGLATRDLVTCQSVCYQYGDTFVGEMTGRGKAREQIIIVRGIAKRELAAMQKTIKAWCTQAGGVATLDAPIPSCGGGGDPC